MQQTEGSLEKLKIIAYKDENFGSQIGEYPVQVNPEKYTHDHKTSFTNKKSTETSGVTTKYVAISPEAVKFDLYFDVTGVIGGITSIADAIQQFKDLVYTYNGSIHSPNYLKLLWGSLIFKCRLTSLNIEYTLFKPSGIPLRAKAGVSFEEYISPEELARRANKSSPDLSHVRLIRAGDTLPLLCHNIYGDSKYYLQVAHVNGLTDFRNLQVGTRIEFPPLAD